MNYKILRFFKEGKGLLLVNIAVVACLGWAVSLWVNQFISNKAAKIPAYSPPMTNNIQTIQMNTDYSVITKKNIFNPVGPSGLAGATSGEVVPSTLPLKLVGTIISGNKDSSMAIIEGADKQQELYKMNDQVGGATIIRIERFEIILSNGGRLESLAIDFGQIGTPADTGKKGAAPGVQVAQTAGRIIMDKGYFNAQKKNTSELMTQIRAIPFAGKDGVISGFQLFEVAKDSMYDRVGLKNQDVIQRVNGQPLTSVESGLDLFNALKNDTHFTLDIVRNRENKTIRVDVQ
jgi:general secretion pathway protein C